MAGLTLKKQGARVVLPVQTSGDGSVGSIPAGGTSCYGGGHSAIALVRSTYFAGFESVAGFSSPEV